LKEFENHVISIVVFIAEREEEKGWGGGGGRRIRNGEGGGGKINENLEENINIAVCVCVVTTPADSVFFGSRYGFPDHLQRPPFLQNVITRGPWHLWWWDF